MLGVYQNVCRLIGNSNIFGPFENHMHFFFAAIQQPTNAAVIVVVIAGVSLIVTVSLLIAFRRKLPGSSFLVGWWCYMSSREVHIPGYKACRPTSPGDLENSVSDKPIGVFAYFSFFVELFSMGVWQFTCELTFYYCNKIDNYWCNED